MNDTKIEWADRTWNPVSGCTKISAGCKYCYAESIAERFGGPAYPNGFGITLRPHRIDDPKKWKKPARVFVNSMSDLFHEDIPPEFLEECLEVMRDCPQHTFQILTKRPEQMLKTMWAWYDCDCENCTMGNGCGFLPNIWLGVSVESQKVIDRIDRLREAPAAVRFLSLEPLLGPVEADFTGIDWVIIGGESGPKARSLELSWVRDIIDQCRRDGAAVFVKQLGSRHAKNHYHVNHPKAGDPLEWPVEIRIREFPGEVAPC